MITEVSQILQGIIKAETEKLSQEELYHAPTIGDMYEGLARDILARTIPGSLNLQVVEGFVEGPDGELGPQTDGLLVFGDKCKRVPYTNSVKCPVENVIAVFEFKKTFFGREFDDSLEKMRKIQCIFRNAAQAKKYEDRSVSAIISAFKNQTGNYVDASEVSELNENFEHIFWSLLEELLSPIKVVFAYDGYKTEDALRNAFINQLEKRMYRSGSGPTSLPTHIVCAENSILKMNGLPYASPRNDDWWDIYGSAGKDPLRILIEYIWASIEAHFDMSMPQDDNLLQERVIRLLQGRVVRKGDKIGWEYKFSPVSHGSLTESGEWEWQPDRISVEEWVILNIASNHGQVKLSDHDLIAHAKEYKTTPLDIVRSLVEKRLLLWWGEEAAVPNDGEFITSFTPDGDVFVSREHVLTGAWACRVLEARDNQNADKA